MKAGDKLNIDILQDTENPVTVIGVQITTKYNDRTKIMYKLCTASGIKFWMTAFDADNCAKLLKIPSQQISIEGIRTDLPF